VAIAEIVNDIVAISLDVLLSRDSPERLMASQNASSVSPLRLKNQKPLWGRLRAMALAEASDFTIADTRRDAEELPRMGAFWGVVVPLLLPFFALIVLTAIFRLTNLDVAICRLFYGSADNMWPWSNSQPWEFAYRYGNLPGVVLGIGGLIVGLASLIWSRLRPYRQAGFFLAAVLALGPGLLVNGIFKPYWCRPRPVEIVDFGGNQPFVSVWGWDSASQSRSFPSGHASTGFFLMVPAFLLYRRRRGLALSCALVGLACGAFMGLARVVQGGHFPSDVLWSGGMVYISGLALSFVFNLGKRTYRVAEPDETGKFEPVVIAPDMGQDIARPADQPPSTQEKIDRRKAA